MHGNSPTRRIGAGLRGRSALSFGLGALLVASIMASLTFVIARTYLLRQREEQATRQTFVNARLVRDSLADPTTDIAELLSSLRADGRSEAAAQVGDQWFATSVAVGADSIPSSVRELVDEGSAVRQLVALDGVATLVNGVPLGGTDAQYYELFPLRELPRTLNTLAAALAVSATVAALAGAIVGLFASRRVLRPLREVAATATEITSGSLDHRLEVAVDPDLSPLTDAFNEMVDALQERIAREARFSSDVSHEMRAPLAAMSAAMSIAKRRRDGLPNDIQQLIDVIDDQIVSFQTLTVDLLEIAKVDAGSEALRLEPVDPGTFVEHFVAANESELRVRIAAKPGSVLVDKRRMRQVLTNLVSNAARYGGGADEIVVTGGDDGMVRICVDDRGPGVPPDEREAIFRRFERGQAASTRREVRGTGLGLALAREHVELHGGRLWVEDRPGGGARFVVELPVAEGPSGDLPLDGLPWDEAAS